MCQPHGGAFGLMDLVSNMLKDCTTDKKQIHQVISLVSAIKNELWWPVISREPMNLQNTLKMNDISMWVWTDGTFSKRILLATC